MTSKVGLGTLDRKPDMVVENQRGPLSREAGTFNYRGVMRVSPGRKIAG